MDALPALLPSVAPATAQRHNPDDDCRAAAAFAYRLALALDRTQAEAAEAATRAYVGGGSDLAWAENAVLNVIDAQMRTRHLWLKRPLRPQIVHRSQPRSAAAKPPNPAPPSQARQGEGTAARVHLVTVLYNGEASLPGFLDSLKAQTFRDWRLIAVDNVSRDRSCEVVTVARDDRITLIRNTANLGFAKAANQGLRAAVAAGGEFFVLLNPDTAFSPAFLGDLIARRDALRAPVIVPRIMYMQQPDEAWYAGGHLEDGWVFKNVHEPHDPGDTRPARPVDFASGCCLGLTRDVLERVGLFDESFFVYWEDADLCLRLKHNGVPIVYVREPSLSHAGGTASGGEHSMAYNRLYYRSYVQLLRKHFGLSDALSVSAASPAAAGTATGPRLRHDPQDGSGDAERDDGSPRGGKPPVRPTSAIADLLMEDSTRQRAAKLLRLLASDVAGEAEAARAALLRLFARHGATFDDLACSLLDATPPSSDLAPREPSALQAAVTAAEHRAMVAEAASRSAAAEAKRQHTVAARWRAVGIASAGALLVTSVFSLSGGPIRSYLRAGLSSLEPALEAAGLPGMLRQALPVSASAVAVKAPERQPVVVSALMPPPEPTEPRSQRPRSSLSMARGGRVLSLEGVPLRLNPVPGSFSVAFLPQGARISVDEVFPMLDREWMQVHTPQGDGFVPASAIGPE